MHSSFRLCICVRLQRLVVCFHQRFVNQRSLHSVIPPSTPSPFSFSFVCKWFFLLFYPLFHPCGLQLSLPACPRRRSNPSLSNHLFVFRVFRVSFFCEDVHSRFLNKCAILPPPPLSLFPESYSRMLPVTHCILSFVCVCFAVPSVAGAVTDRSSTHLYA